VAGVFGRHTTAVVLGHSFDDRQTQAAARIPGCVAAAVETAEELWQVFHGNADAGVLD
jgi:hypothetical protein